LTLPLARRFRHLDFCVLHFDLSAWHRAVRLRVLYVRRRPRERL
jgi:hypothetical protein